MSTRRVSDSFFSIARRYQNVETGELCSVVLVQDALDRFDTEQNARIPHWLRIRSVSGNHVEIQVFGHHRSCSRDAIVGVSMQSGLIHIMHRDELESTFVPLGQNQHLFDQDAEGNNGVQP